MRDRCQTVGGAERSGAAVEGADGSGHIHPEEPRSRWVPARSVRAATEPQRQPRAHSVRRVRRPSPCTYEPGDERQGRIRDTANHSGTAGRRRRQPAADRPNIRGLVPVRVDCEPVSRVGVKPPPRPPGRHALAG